MFIAKPLVDDARSLRRSDYVGWREWRSYGALLRKDNPAINILLLRSIFNEFTNKVTQRINLGTPSNSLTLSQQRTHRLVILSHLQLPRAGRRLMLPKLLLQVRQVVAHP